MWLQLPPEFEGLSLYCRIFYLLANERQLDTLSMIPSCLLRRRTRSLNYNSASHAKPCIVLTERTPKSCRSCTLLDWRLADFTRFGRNVALDSHLDSKSRIACCKFSEASFGLALSFVNSFWICCTTASFTSGSFGTCACAWSTSLDTSFSTWWIDPMVLHRTVSPLTKPAENVLAVTRRSVFQSRHRWYRHRCSHVDCPAHQHRALVTLCLFPVRVVPSSTGLRPCPHWTWHVAAARCLKREPVLHGKLAWYPSTYPLRAHLKWVV